jgi:outer membrane lipoprotein-sorting protein
VVVAVGVGVTALALAVSPGPTPPPKPLAEAVHDALSAPPVSGVSARIQFTNHLLEGASLTGGEGGQASQLASSPLLSGATGRLWIGSDGRARLELQSEKGDTQILYDGHKASLYDAATNTLYRLAPPPESGSNQGTSSGAASNEADHNEIPTVAKIEEGIAQLTKHANLSGATPSDVAGQAAYTVRISPREDGGLIGGAELSWDASNGVPLRAAVYSTTSASPVMELAASEISYGPMDGSTLNFTPPANAKIEEVTLPAKHESGASGSSPTRPHVTTHGKGLAAIALVEDPTKAGERQSASSQPEGLQQVSINGTSASELPTALGTLLSFERAGVHYLLVGSVTPASIEAFARGL